MLPTSTQHRARLAACYAHVCHVVCLSHSLTPHHPAKPKQRPHLICQPPGGCCCAWSPGAAADADATVVGRTLRALLMAATASPHSVPSVLARHAAALSAMQ